MTVILPQPFAIAIDDLGWNVGKSDKNNANQGPSRLGLNRTMSIHDYKCIVDVAKRVGVRIMGLFVLSEMDRENVLKNYPSTNADGADWDNSQNINDSQIEIMNFVREHAAYLEFGLHGVGHEHWPEPGKRKRAEWYNKQDNHPWPEKTIDNVIKCFKEILSQYNLSPPDGHSFPESFVPCSYAMHWDPERDLSTGSKLRPEGVKYANTLFEELNQPSLPSGPDGGALDHGMLVVNRIIYGNDWYEIASLPSVPIEEQESSVIESHWNNWLAQDDLLQPALNEEWISYYRYIQKQANRYVAKNSEQFYSQWIYNKYCKIDECEPGHVMIDNTAIPDEYYKYELVKNLVLKVKLGKNIHISSAMINGKNISSYYEEGGFGFLYLPKLKQKKYVLKYELGDSFLDTYVFNNGTYNVYSFDYDKTKTSIEVRLYGTQEIQICGIEKPTHISVNNSNVFLINWQYDPEEMGLKMILQAHDIQGENMNIDIEHKT